jgi:hypothetical protein
LELDEKFHWWHGDQESMRDITNSGQLNTRLIPKSYVAGLPEYVNAHADAIGSNFKSANRKSHMRSFAEQILSQYSPIYSS